jgi:hypothetical protein
MTVKRKTIAEAQKHLPDLIRQAQKEAIGLVDENGELVGLLSGISEDDLDDLIVQTRGFKEMIARSIASLEISEPVPLEVILEEARAELAAEQAEKAARRSRKGK